jgi:hypothetical protein
MLVSLILESGNICHVNRAWVYFKKDCFQKALSETRLFEWIKTFLSETRLGKTRMKVLRLDVDG